MSARLDELKTRLLEASDLGAAAAVLNWDQATYMPPGGAEARGRQMATLGRLAHEKFTDAAVGRLLEALEKETAGLPPDSDEAALVRVTRREYERAVRVPPAFVAEMSEHASASYNAWTAARPANARSRPRPTTHRARLRPAAHAAPACWGWKY